MISRALLLSTVIGFSSVSLLPSAAVLPLTAHQLQLKAKLKSRSDVCRKKKKSKTVRQLCQQWEAQSKL